MTTVFIVSAPSGSGKSTLVKRLLALDHRLRFSISYTTRAPRGHESHGHEYHYVGNDEFEALAARGEFLEHALVIGNYYGTHRRYLDEAQSAGADLVLDIDVQGARQLKHKFPDAVTVFILPPSRQVLEQRLRDRSEDTEETIQKRLREAAKEIRNYSWYDYVLVNREVEASVEILASIVQSARARRARMEEEVRPILASFESERTP
jgi:guanylate kinase